MLYKKLTLRKFKLILAAQIKCIFNLNNCLITNQVLDTSLYSLN